MRRSLPTHRSEGRARNEAEQDRPRLVSGSDSAAEDTSDHVRRDHYVIRPDQVLQPDRRPWARLTLEQVVVKMVLISAAAIALFLIFVAAVARLLGLW